MADQKISQLTPYSGLDVIATDLLPIVDTTNSQTKSIAFDEFTSAVLTSVNFLAKTGGSMVGDLNFEDNYKATFGDGSDFEIYHDGTYSYVGSLKFDADGHIVDPVTINAALNVGGTVTATGLDMNGTADFGGNINLSMAESTTIKRTDNTGLLSLQGGDDALSTALVMYGNAHATLPNWTVLEGDTMLFRPVDNDPEFMRFVDGTGAVFNENSADLDFRIESDTNSHAFFLQGSDGKIGIGTGSPLQSLHVNSNGNTQLLISSSFNNSTVTGLVVDTVGDSSVFRISATKSGVGRGTLSFLHSSTAALETWNLNAAGSTVYAAGYSEHIWKTVNTERLRITSTGKVGIGDSDPPTILSVRGDTPESRITNTNPISDTGGTEEVARLGVYGQKNGLYAPAANIVFRQDASTWSSVDAYQKGTRIEFCTQDATATDTSETPRMVINKDGDVGIGTDDPQARLDVTDATGNQLVVATNTNAPDTEAGILFKHATNSNNFEGGGIRSVRNGSNNDFGLALDAGVNGVSTQAMFISGVDTTPGYVGINTSSPSEKLHISGTGETILVTPVAYSANQDSPYLIASGTNYNGATTNWSTYGFQHRLKVNAGGTPRVTIDNNTGELFCVATAGVGIGTDSPSAKLDVNGTVKAKSYVETYVTLSGTTPTITCTDGNFFGLNTTGNTTFTFASAPASGTGYGFSLRLTAGGTHTLTWPASVKWPGGTAPDNPASGETNIYAFVTHDGGTTWYGMVGGEAFS